MMDEINYDELDPGVRNLVRWLRHPDHCFYTTDSGDGVSKFKDDPDYAALPYPHVVIVVDDHSELCREADRLRQLLWIDHGIEAKPMGPEDDFCEPNIQATYDPTDGTAVIILVNVDDSMLRK
jgi:hypothetical protein